MSRDHKSAPTMGHAQGHHFHGNKSTGKHHSNSKWMQHAVKHPGALTRKAEHAGMGVQAYAHKHAHDKGTTGKQARLAITFSKFRKGK